MESQKNKILSYNDYITLEQDSETKHELINGQLYAKTGGTIDHDRIKSNVIYELRKQTEGTDCYIATGDANLKIDISENGYYPDSMLVCGKNEHEYYVTRPLIVIEVLSKSTQHRDLIEKANDYLKIPGLLYYLVFDFQARQCIVYTKNNKPAYETERVNLHFNETDILINISDIYSGVDFS